MNPVIPHTELEQPLLAVHGYHWEGGRERRRQGWKGEKERRKEKRKVGRKERKKEGRTWDLGEGRNRRQLRFGKS